MKHERQWQQYPDWTALKEAPKWPQTGIFQPTYTSLVWLARLNFVAEREVGSSAPEYYLLRTYPLPTMRSPGVPLPAAATTSRQGMCLTYCTCKTHRASAESSSLTFCWLANSRSSFILAITYRCRRERERYFCTVCLHVCERYHGF